MLIRWVLTIAAITLFSIITAKFVKKTDIPQKQEKLSGIHLNKDACMGCTICTKKYPELFEMNNKKAKLKEFDEVDYSKLQEVCESCPVNAIEYIY